MTLHQLNDFDPFCPILTFLWTYISNFLLNIFSNNVPNQFKSNESCKTCCILPSVKPFLNISISAKGITIYLATRPQFGVKFRVAFKFLELLVSLLCFLSYVMYSLKICHPFTPEKDWHFLPRTTHTFLSFKFSATLPEKGWASPS